MESNILQSEAEPTGRTVTCLVIGPIGDKFAEHGSDERAVYEDSLRVLEEVIVPACEAFGVHPIRSDAIAQPGEIPEQIFQLLRDADIVIADQTDGNPNVMYELGLRHTRDLCTIGMAEYGRIPFDVSIIRTIIFRRTPAGLIDAREDLKASINECLAGNHRPVTATRLWMSATIPLPDDGGSGEPSGDVSSADEEEGFLERIAEMEDALPQLLTLMNQLNEVTQDIGALFQATQAEVEEMDRKGPAPASARLTVAARVGTQLGGRADKLEEIADSFEQQLSRADRGMSTRISAVEDDPNRLAELGELPNSVEIAAEQIREAMVAGEETATIIASLASIARPLRGPSNRIAKAIRRVTKASAMFQVWEYSLSLDSGVHHVAGVMR
jgi:hypothetical protein